MNLDPFRRQKVYPDAGAVFRHTGKTPAQMIEECIVVVDTNALLLPYITGTSSLDEIGRVYGQLAATERLAVPGQVAREFAQLRATKLGELFQQLSKMKDHDFPKSKPGYPLLEGLPTYKALLEAEDAILDEAKKYRKHVEALLADVKGWAWNDPVSVVYGSMLADCVVDPKLDESAVLERLRFNNANKVPPGYKDGGKDDDGIGDLLIWLAILEVGAKKQDLLFVTGEEKADWWHRSSGQPLYPRFELVDEYRRASGGRTFAICKLSELLELMKASEAVVEQVQQSEAEQEKMRRDVIAISYGGRPEGHQVVLRYDPAHGQTFENAVEEARWETVERDDLLEVAIRRMDLPGHPWVCRWKRGRVGQPWRFKWMNGADDPTAVPPRLV